MSFPSRSHIAQLVLPHAPMPASAQHAQGLRLHDAQAVQQWLAAACDAGMAAPILWLPHSEQPVQDLRWLRSQGLDAWLHQHVAQGGRVLGTGAGLWMLGEGLMDAQRIDGNAPGLGLLPLATLMDQLPGAASWERWTLPAITGAWQCWSGRVLHVQPVTGVQTQLRADMQQASAQPARELLPAQAWLSGNGQVLGLACTDGV